jgi:hypothetical protein
MQKRVSASPPDRAARAVPGPQLRTRRKRRFQSLPPGVLGLGHLSRNRKQRESLNHRVVVTIVRNQWHLIIKSAGGYPGVSSLNSMSVSFPVEGDLGPHAAQFAANGQYGVVSGAVPVQAFEPAPSHAPVARRLVGQPAPRRRGGKAAATTGSNHVGRSFPRIQDSRMAGNVACHAYYPSACRSLSRAIKGRDGRFRSS